MSIRSAANSELLADYIQRIKEEHGYTPFEYWQPPKKVYPRGVRKFNSKEFLNKLNESQRRVARTTPGYRRQTQPRPSTAQRRQMQEYREARMKRQRQRQQQQQQEMAAAARGPSNRDSAVGLEPLEEEDESSGYEWQPSVPPTYQQAVRAAKGVGLPANPASFLDEKRMLAAASESIRSSEEHPALRGGGGDSILSVEEPLEKAKHSWFVHDDPTKKGLRAWRIRTWVLFSSMLIILIATAIVVPVLVPIQQHIKYPEHFTTNYALAETSSSTNLPDPTTVIHG